MQLDVARYAATVAAAEICARRTTHRSSSTRVVDWAQDDADLQRLRKSRAEVETAYKAFVVADRVAQKADGELRRAYGASQIMALLGYDLDTPFSMETEAINTSDARAAAAVAKSAADKAATGRLAADHEARKSVADATGASPMELLYRVIKLQQEAAAAGSQGAPLATPPPESSPPTSLALPGRGKASAMHAALLKVPIVARVISACVRFQSQFRAVRARRRYAALRRLRVRLDRQQLQYTFVWWHRYVASCRMNHRALLKRGFAMLQVWWSLQTLKRRAFVLLMSRCRDTATTRRTFIVWFRYARYLSSPMDHATGRRNLHLPSPSPCEAWDEFLSAEAMRHKVLVSGNATLINRDDAVMVEGLYWHRWRTYVATCRRDKQNWYVACSHCGLTTLQRHFSAWSHLVCFMAQRQAMEAALKQYFLRRWQRAVRKEREERRATLGFSKVSIMGMLVKWRRKTVAFRCEQASNLLLATQRRPLMWWCLSHWNPSCLPPTLTVLIRAWRQWQEAAGRGRTWRAFIGFKWSRRQVFLKGVCFTAWVRLVDQVKDRGETKLRTRLKSFELAPKDTDAELFEELTTVVSRTKLGVASSRIHHAMSAAAVAEEEYQSVLGRSGTPPAPAADAPQQSRPPSTKAVGFDVAPSEGSVFWKDAPIPSADALSREGRGLKSILAHWVWAHEQRNVLREASSETATHFDHCDELHDRPLLLSVARLMLLFAKRRSRHRAKTLLLDDAAAAVAPGGSRHPPSSDRNRLLRRALVMSAGPPLYRDEPRSEFDVAALEAQVRETSMTNRARLLRWIRRHDHIILKVNAKIAAMACAATNPYFSLVTDRMVAFSPYQALLERYQAMCQRGASRPRKLAIPLPPTSAAAKVRLLLRLRLHDICQPAALSMALRAAVTARLVRAAEHISFAAHSLFATTQSNEPPTAPAAALDRVDTAARAAQPRELRSLSREALVLKMHMCAPRRQVVNYRLQFSLINIAGFNPMFLRAQRSSGAKLLRQAMRDVSAAVSAAAEHNRRHAFALKQQLEELDRLAAAVKSSAPPHERDELESTVGSRASSDELVAPTTTAPITPSLQRSTSAFFTVGEFEGFLRRANLAGRGASTHPLLASKRRNTIQCLDHSAPEPPSLSIVALQSAAADNNSAPDASPTSEVATDISSAGNPSGRRTTPRSQRSPPSDAGSGAGQASGGLPLGVSGDLLFSFAADALDTADEASATTDRPNVEIADADGRLSVESPTSVPQPSPGSHGRRTPATAPPSPAKPPAVAPSPTPSARFPDPVVAGKAPPRQASPPQTRPAAPPKHEAAAVEQRAAALDEMAETPQEAVQPSTKPAPKATRVNVSAAPAPRRGERPWATTVKRQLPPPKPFVAAAALRAKDAHAAAAPRPPTPLSRAAPVSAPPALPDRRDRATLGVPAFERLLEVAVRHSTYLQQSCRSQIDHIVGLLAGTVGDPVVTPAAEASNTRSPTRWPTGHLACTHADRGACRESPLVPDNVVRFPWRPKRPAPGGTRDDDTDAKAPQGHKVPDEDENWTSPARSNRPPTAGPSPRGRHAVNQAAPVELPDVPALTRASVLSAGLSRSATASGRPTTGGLHELTRIATAAVAPDSVFGGHASRVASTATLLHTSLTLERGSGADVPERSSRPEDGYMQAFAFSGRAATPSKAVNGDQRREAGTPAPVASGRDDITQVRKKAEADADNAELDAFEEWLKAVHGRMRRGDGAREAAEEMAAQKDLLLRRLHRLRTAVNSGTSRTTDAAGSSDPQRGRLQRLIGGKLMALHTLQHHQRVVHPQVWLESRDAHHPAPTGGFLEPPRREVGSVQTAPLSDVEVARLVSFLAGHPTVSK